MHLINATTLELERFDDEARIPPYAILSHTWGNSEITFEKLHSLRSDDNCVGAWKIRQTCRQALEHDLQYAWVDTCCIDKRSSAELSEAINSMYKWYILARRCYVYLEDVRTQEELGMARWFTRGWTLQELIAPLDIEFYNSSWSPLGWKHSLSATLSTITGIEEEVLLLRKELDEISIAQRMSWAAGRTTTRAEDMAYSLLGIFDINMPLLYGEGEKAFMRLQEEIMKDSNDQSLFAWNPEATRTPDLRPPLGRKRRSVFAQHPREFKESSVIRPLHQITPFAMTNNGVRITVPVFSRDRINRHGNSMSDDWQWARLTDIKQSIRKDERLVVVLDCYFASGPFAGDRVGIVCDCVYAPDLHLLRSWSELCPVKDSDFAAAREMEVFLLKKRRT